MSRPVLAVVFTIFHGYPARASDCWVVRRDARDRAALQVM